MSYDISNRSANHRLIYWQQRAGFNNTRLAAAIRERAGRPGTGTSSPMPVGSGHGGKANGHAIQFLN